MTAINNQQLNGVHKGRLLSVVIPSFNYGQFITQAIESVLAQSYAPIELIVVDDGSSDDSIAIVEELARQPHHLERFEIIGMGRNVGKLAAINRGMQEVRGHYTIVLDADDQLVPDYASRCIETLEQARVTEPQTAFVYTDCLLISEAGEMLDRGRSTAFDPELIKQYSFIPEPAVVLSEVMHEAGPFDETIRRGTKHHKWQRIINNGWGGLHIAEPMFCYRMHTQNLSGIGRRVIGEIENGTNGERILTGYWPTAARS